MATILSAQSTDARVNLVTPALFKRYPNARAGEGDAAALEPQIHSTGFLPRQVEGAHRHGAGARRGSRRRGAGRHGRARRAAGRRAQDRERRARPRARRPGPAGRSARPARREPHRHRRVRRSGGRRAAAGGALPAGALDARVGHADPPRPPHLQAEAALRPVCARARTTATGSAGALGRRQSPEGAEARGKRAVRGPRPAFERLVADALASIPRRFRDAMQNIAIVVEDEPSPELLAEMDIEPPDTLLGLYQGTPLTERRLGLRQRAARPHPDLSGPARARGRRTRTISSSRSARR